MGLLRNTENLHCAQTYTVYVYVNMAGRDWLSSGIHRSSFKLVLKSMTLIKCHTLDLRLSAALSIKHRGTEAFKVVSCVHLIGSSSSWKELAANKVISR